MAQGYTQPYTRSGYSGFSGGATSGASGYSGYSGTSGYSGFSGFSGYSGFSAASGYSGFSCSSGFSGFSGYSGYSGVSGYSGYSGVSGYSGFSGRSGFSGFSGFAGSSDIRLKRDIRPFTDGLNIIEQIEPVLYKYNALMGLPDLDNVGIIGQQMQTVFPETIASKVGEHGEMIEFDALPVVFALLNAVRELDERLRKLRGARVH